MKISYVKQLDHIILNVTDEDDVLLSVNVFSPDDIEKVLQSLDYFILSLMSIRGVSEEVETDGDALESVLLSLLSNE